MSDLQTNPIRLSKAVQYINLVAVQATRPVMLWGPPGVGKSDAIRGIVDQMKASGRKAIVKDMRLSMCEPTDLMGIPYFDSTRGVMAWAPPTLLPNAREAEENDLIILFLDEINGGAPAVQAAAYQLTLDRQVGEYRLPDNCIVIAAGNRNSDKGVTYRMPTPLANRFIHFEVKAHFDDWAVWASDNRIHPDILGYLTTNKKELFEFDPRSPDPAFRTPRSWHAFSDILWMADKAGYSHADVADLASGTLGTGVGVSFTAHRKTSALLPNPSDVLQGKVTDLKTKEISALFTLAISMVYEINEARADKNVSEETELEYINNAVGFWMDHFQEEMIVMAARMVVRGGTAFNFKTLSNWKKFSKRYSKLVFDVST